MGTSFASSGGKFFSKTGNWIGGINNNNPCASTDKAIANAMRRVVLRKILFMMGGAWWASYIALICAKQVV
jgi:hypothetical protein